MHPPSSSVLLSDGDFTYTWDRAERLRTVDDGSVTTQYAYNGVGQRLSQTVDSVITEYLLDVQPGLTKVIRQTTGANNTAFVHGPTGLIRQQQPDGAWLSPLSDGLGSVRTLVDETTLLPVMSQHYGPYGQPLDTQGSGTPYGFTGEQTDPNTLLYLRARYYNPALGVFPNLDPMLEGNHYGYVTGNPVNLIDPTGLIGEKADSFNCQSSPFEPPFDPMRQGTNCTDFRNFSRSDVYTSSIDTTLLDDWGIVLTVYCGLPGSNVQWTTINKENILAAFRAVGNAIRLSLYGYQASILVYTQFIGVTVPRRCKILQGI